MKRWRFGRIGFLAALESSSGFDALEIRLLDSVIVILPLDKEGSPCAQKPGIN
jgi:hypothetical protein